MKPPRPLVRIRDCTIGRPSIVNGFLKRRWITAVPFARSALTVLQALPPPPSGSIACAVAGLPPLEFIRRGPRRRIVTVLGCRRSQFAAAKRAPPPGATPGHLCVYASTLPFRGRLLESVRY